MTIEQAKTFIELHKNNTNLSNLDLQKFKLALKVVSTSWAKR